MVREHTRIGADMTRLCTMRGTLITNRILLIMRMLIEPIIVGVGMEVARGEQ